MPRVAISELRRGIENNPAFEGTILGARDLLNLEIDEIGRTQLRQGYVVDDSEVMGDGGQVVKVHFIGDADRDAFSRIYRLDQDETWVFDNGRLFVAGVREPMWIDVEDNTAYDWEMETPTGSITEISPDPIILEGEEDAVSFSHRFAICFTFYSTKFGIESLPSTSKAFQVSVPREDVDVEEFPGINFTATYELGVVPGWADEVRFYMMSVPFGSDDFYFVQDPGPNSISGNSPNIVAAAYASRQRLANIQGTIINTQKMIEAGYRFDLIGRLGASTPGEFELDSDRSFAVNFIYVQSTDADGDAITGPEIDTARFSERFIFLYPGNPTDGFGSLLEHAGRIWAYDGDTNLIRYSLIDETHSVYDVFPLENVEIPHAINVPESYQSGVIHLEKIPPAGGVYVFFSNAIRTITGRALLTGLFSPDSPPQTDLDASGGIDSVGTLSPRSVIAFRNVVVFFASDKNVYQLGGAGMGLTDIGLRIQEDLDEVREDDFENVHAFGWNDRYFISIPERGLFVYDQKRGYWTRYDFDIKSAFWSRGGENNESILYAVRDDNQLLRLFEGDDDDGDDIEWAWESNEIGFPSDFTTLGELYLRHNGEASEVDVEVEVDERIVATRPFEPKRNNKFRFGFHANGGTIKAKVSGTGAVPRFRGFELEFD